MATAYEDREIHHAGGPMGAYARMTRPITRRAVTFDGTA
jgi:hypothetical protein